jgi:predicted phosphate transport protein (TIGR00153 family)
MKIFSSKTKEVESDIDKYLDHVEQSALIFNLAIKDYINKKFDKFEERFKEVAEIERSSDELRREIKYKIYAYMLIPESRGDVLGLIETIDNVIDVAKKVLSHFSIEKPEIIDELKDDFMDLAEASSKSVIELVKATRAFFREINVVNDYINQVHFWEHEADKIEETLKRKAFNSDKIKIFSRKVHMRYFAERISLLADEAEAVTERLAVYAIKRTI